MMMSATITPAETAVPTGCTALVLEAQVSHPAGAVTSLTAT
jgi:hypothetical protein